MNYKSYLLAFAFFLSIGVILAFKNNSTSSSSKSMRLTSIQDLKLVNHSEAACPEAKWVDIAGLVCSGPFVCSDGSVGYFYGWQVTCEYWYDGAPCSPEDNGNCNIIYYSCP